MTLEGSPGLLVWLGEVKHAVNLATDAHHRVISMEEVSTHDKRTDAWTVIKGKVYNVTSFIEYHPGGVKMLMKAAGKDGTALFNKYHDYVNIDLTIENLLIGYLDAVPSAVGLQVDTSTPVSQAVSNLAISPTSSLSQLETPVISSEANTQI